jgi:hypothetical protein
MPTTMSRVQDERVAGAVAVLVALAGMAFANFSTDPGENGGAAEFAVTGAIMLLVAALVFGRVLPNTTQPGKLAGVFLLGALATVLVFWSGLPIVFGVAAMVAGLRARTTGGTLAAVAGVALAAADAVVLVIG